MRGPNCIRMNPRSRCASGMLGSSSTVYNEQPTSADSCLLGHALKLVTRQIYNNLTKIQHISVSVGLTPAHMGKTGGCWVKAACWWAHPAHTGNATLSFQSSFTTTAHPPIRGTRGTSGISTVMSRLIPAHTGNTPAPSRSRNISRAHPRAYGEPSLQPLLFSSA